MSNTRRSSTTQSVHSFSPAPPLGSPQYSEFYGSPGNIFKQAHPCRSELSTGYACQSSGGAMIMISPPPAIGDIFRTSPTPPPPLYRWSVESPMRGSAPAHNNLLVRTVVVSILSYRARWMRFARRLAIP